MRNRILVGLIAAGMAFGGAVGLSTGAQAASQDVDPAVAIALDSAAVAFTRHNREHRMWEIQRNMERQQRGGRGYGRGYNNRRGYVGRPGGYGYRGGYQGTPGWAGRPGY